MTANVFVVLRGQTWTPALLDSPACQWTEADTNIHSTSLSDIENSDGIKDPIILSVKSLQHKTEDKAQV